MAKTGVVKKQFPYAPDGVNIEHLKEGRVMAFPDRTFDGLKEAGYIDESSDEPENSIADVAERDVVAEETDRRLMAMSDGELKSIIARSGTPVSGNLVHANLIAAAKYQLQREASGKEPVRGVDPNSGVTEQPLAAPGAPTPPSAPAAVAAAEGLTTPTNQSGEPVDGRKTGGRPRK